MNQFERLGLGEMGRPVAAADGGSSRRRGRSQRCVDIAAVWQIIYAAAALADGAASKMRIDGWLHSGRTD